MKRIYIVSKIIDSIAPGSRSYTIYGKIGMIFSLVLDNMVESCLALCLEARTLLQGRDLVNSIMFALDCHVDVLYNSYYCTGI